MAKNINKKAWKV